MLINPVQPEQASQDWQERERERECERERCEAGLMAAPSGL